MTDSKTDGHRMTAQAALMHNIARQKLGFGLPTINIQQDTPEGIFLLIAMSQTEYLLPETFTR